MDLLTIALLTLIIFVIIILATFALAGILAAPWVPARKRDIGRILKAAAIKPGETVYDLGCGDARLLIAAARTYEIKSVGFEIAVLPYLIAKAKILLFGLTSKIKLKFKNFYQCDLSQADIVTTFLSPWAMQKLKPKFEKELKPGCRVVSYAFHIPDWQPAVVDKPTAKDLTVFVYKIK